MRYLSFILCFVFCFGCGRPSETRVDTMCFDLDKLSDDVRFSDLFERVDLIPLETSDSSLLTPAVILAAYHDTLYVMDQISDRDSMENWLGELSIRDAMQGLGQREKNILYLRFFRGKTQMEVAGEIGISQAQVSRLEKSALQHMRKFM